MLNDDQRILLGQRLKELRQQRELSAAHLAEQALGYQNGSHVAITRLERGILSAPRKDHLEKLAAFFGIEPELLFVSELEQEPSATPRTSKLAAAPVKSLRPRPGTVGQRIRHLREERSLELADFAAGIRQAGPLVLQSDVQAWESDEREPNPVQLQALYRFTGCSPQWLMAEELGGVAA